MFRQTFPGGRNSLIQLTHRFSRVCHFQIRSNITIEKPKAFEHVSPSSKKFKVRFYHQLFSCVVGPSDFLPNSLSYKLSYKMRITNHQSLGDPKFPVKPCTPESTSRRDPKTSVGSVGTWTPSAPEVVLPGFGCWVFEGDDEPTSLRSWQDF